jgi:hypothetical protein
MEYSICGCLRCMPLWLFPAASCFVCFSVNFMFYGLEQLDCFQMPTLRFQHWVFPSQDVFMNFWHLLLPKAASYSWFMVYGLMNLSHLHYSTSDRSLKQNLRPNWYQTPLWLVWRCVIAHLTMCYSAFEFPANSFIHLKRISIFSCLSAVWRHIMTLQ